MADVLPEGVTWDQFNEVKGYLCQWRFGSLSGQSSLQALQKFSENNPHTSNLFNTESGCYLQWEKQTFGINLGWTDHGDQATPRKVARWLVSPADGHAGPIRYGDAVALGYGTEPSFYKYGHREIGINLENVKAPAFEWRIVGKSIGQPVGMGDMVAIYNTQVERDGELGDFFVRHHRDAGANIGWTTSPDGHFIKSIINKYGKQAATLAIAALLGGS